VLAHATCKRRRIMKYVAVVFLAVLTRPLVVAAQPSQPQPHEPTWIVGGGLGLGGVSAVNDSDVPSIGDVGFGEVLFRPARAVPLYIHAMYAGSIRSSNNTWSNPRIGAEYRPCQRLGLCVLFDADVGYLSVRDICQDSGNGTSSCDGSATFSPVARSGFALSGRFGVDVGWEHVRVRFALDATRALPDAQFKVAQLYGTHDLGSFFALEVGVAAAF
jgi:hypothetical protein